MSLLTKHSAPVAILLFTRSAGQEAVHKGFMSQKSGTANVAVAAQLVHQATATARLAGVDFLCINSTQQTGSTFGARLSGAMQQAFASGYEQLVVIGNDCPQLDAALLRRALAALAQTGAVLGPATDGGVYLLGVARAYFEAQAWAALPWQTATLGRALARHLRASGAAIEKLPELADIDNERDLARALQRALPWRLLRTLRRLRGGPVAATTEHPARATRPVGAPAQPRRGPPAC